MAFIHDEKLGPELPGLRQERRVKQLLRTDDPDLGFRNARAGKAVPVLPRERDERAHEQRPEGARRIPLRELVENAALTRSGRRDVDDVAGALERLERFDLVRAQGMMHAGDGGRIRPGI
jgi:hypothetical protein